MHIRSRSDMKPRPDQQPHERQLLLIHPFLAAADLTR